MIENRTILYSGCCNTSWTGVAPPAPTPTPNQPQHTGTKRPLPLDVEGTHGDTHGNPYDEIVSGQPPYKKRTKRGTRGQQHDRQKREGKGKRQHALTPEGSTSSTLRVVQWWFGGAL